MPQNKIELLCFQRKVIIPDFDLENSRTKVFKVIPYLESSIQKPDANQFSHSAGLELKQLIILHPYVPAVERHTLGQARQSVRHRTKLSLGLKPI